MRNIRKDLDAKNVFLHFTQEQLNAQVVSLETVVKNLKTENHLLNSEASEQKTTIKELTNVKEDLDRLRNSDMEMCLQLREKLARAQEEVEKGESAMRLVLFILLVSF